MPSRGIINVKLDVDIAESVTISDAVAKVQTLIRALAESVTDSETIARIETLSRAIAEAVTDTETIARVETLQRAIAESLTDSETLTRIQTLQRAISDSITDSETLARVETLNRAIAESISDAETIAKTLTMQRAMAETVSDAETIARLQTLQRTTAETVGDTETITRQQTLTRTPGEDSVKQGLLGWWKLDDNAIDSSGKVYDGTWYSTSAYNRGRIARSAGPFTTTTFITVAHNTDLNLMNTDFTIAFWVNLVSTSQPNSYPMILNKEISAGDPNIRRGWNIFFGNSGKKFSLELWKEGAVNGKFSGATVDTTKADWVAGTWYHVAYTYNTTTKTVQVYVNGAYDKAVTDATYTGLVSNNDYLTIGNGGIGSAYPLNGYLDDIRIYNKILSADEFAEIYAQGISSNTIEDTEAITRTQTLIRNIGDDSVKSDLVARWELDEDPAIEAGAITDSVGGYNGVLTTADGSINKSVSAKQGKGIDFDGSNDKIDIPYNAALNPSVFSMSLWARVDGGINNYRSPITSRVSSPQKGYIIYATNANIWSFWFGDGSTWRQVNGPAVVEGEWVHIVITYTGATAHMYINGSEVGTPATYTFVPNNTNVLRIGAGATETAGNYYFNGVIDDVRLYDRVLTDSEISQIYTYGLTAEPVGVSETLSRTQTLARALTDGITLSDALSRALTLTRSMTETANASDSLSRLYTAIRGLSDTISVSEAISRLQSLQKTLTETISASDSLSRLLTAIRQTSENIGISDALGRLQTLQRTLAEIETAVDDAEVHLFNIRLVSESVTISDALERIIIQSRGISDAVSITDDIFATILEPLKAIIQAISEIPKVSTYIDRTKFNAIAKTPGANLESIKPSQSTQKDTPKVEMRYT